MATKDEIKKALLAAAGNPESGPVANIVDEMAKAVVKLLQPEVKDSVEVNFDKSNRETQTIKPLEKR